MLITFNAYRGNDGRVYYGLPNGVKKIIGGVSCLEVTSDFENVLFMEENSLEAEGTEVKRCFCRKRNSKEK